MTCVINIREFPGVCFEMLNSCVPNTRRFEYRTQINSSHWVKSMLLLINEICSRNLHAVRLNCFWCQIRVMCVEDVLQGLCCTTLRGSQIFHKAMILLGVRGAALCYKPEGRGCDSRWCHWNFSLTYSFRSHYGPGADSASSRNEYQ
jgi:hypothetical protein